MGGDISIDPRFNFIIAGAKVVLRSAKVHLGASNDVLPRRNDEDHSAIFITPRSNGEDRAAIFTIGAAKNLLPRAKEHLESRKDEDAGRVMFGVSGIAYE